VKKLEHLQNVGRGDYELFTKKLSAEVIPKAICDLLFEKYLATKKRSASDESDKDAKKVCIEQTIDTPMAVFCNEFSTGESIIENSVGFLEFDHELLGMGEYPQGIFVRECYKSMYQKVNDVFKNTRENTKRVATIMGTSGIGKTVFGLFMIHELLKEGKSVMYYHGGENKYFLFGPQDSGIFEAARQYGYRIPTPTKTCYVGRITTLDSDRTRVGGLQLVGFLEGQSDLYYVHDPPKAGIALREGILCKTIITSSPHRAEENTMDKFEHSFYLPMWTKEELVIANNQFQLGLGSEELEERWKTFGGSARWVLAINKTPGIQKLHRAFRKLTKEHMSSLMDPFSNQSSQISSLVVHMHPNDDLDDYVTGISTSQMFRQICSRLQLSTNAAVQQWVGQ